MSETRLFIVEQTFFIQGRGVLLAPGIAHTNQVKSGDTVELRKPDGSCTRHVIKGIEIMNYQLDIPVEKQKSPITLDTEVDVPQGTEVWHMRA